jgi:hypothetical protein
MFMVVVVGWNYCDSLHLRDPRAMESFEMLIASSCCGAAFPVVKLQFSESRKMASL